MVVYRFFVSGLLAARYPFGLSLSKLEHRCAPVRAELVEAWACSLIRLHACAKCGSRVVAPAGEVLFFASPKKSTQKKGDPQSATPSRCEGVNLRRGGCGVRRGTRFALRAPLGQPRRVSSRSMGAATPMPPHNRPAAGAATGGWTAEQPYGSSLCSTSSRGRKRHALRRLGRAKQWPVWMSDSRVPFTMRRGAQGVGRHGRRSARASCSDSLRLFERSAQRVASSAARPTPEHRRLPAAQRRDAACRVALSLVTFFRRDERKLLRRRAHTPAPVLHQGTPSKPASTRQLRQAQPERTGDRYTPASTSLSPTALKTKNAIKTIATSD